MSAHFFNNFFRHVFRHNFKHVFRQKMRASSRLFMMSLLALICAQCASYNQNSGIGVREIAPEEAGILSCLGFEPHNIHKIAQKAKISIENDFLAKNPSLISDERPLRILIDQSAFTNETPQKINLTFVKDHLAAYLQKAFGNKMAFLSREHIKMIEKERLLKRQGRVDQGALGLVDKIAGADYQLTFKITAQQEEGERRFYQSNHIHLALIDLETGITLWQHNSALNKMGQDGIFCQ